jgi:DNA-directed RNA polymerase specialized sigma24 family protein
MTEQQVLDVIDRVSKRLAPKFRFGYHGIDDMRQMAALFAWQGLEHYDGIRPLENFLWTHVRNRLYNEKRNKYERPDKPCFHCDFYENGECSQYDDIMECELFKGWYIRNTTKKNLMSAIDLESVHDEKENNMRQSDNEEQMDERDLMKLIEAQLPVEYREDFIRLKMNNKLRKVKKERLLLVIMEILEENNIDTQAW